MTAIALSSVQFSCSVMSDSLPPIEPQHARLPCPSPTPGVYSNSCPLSRWCHPTISSSVSPLFSCPQSFPASGSFQMSQLLASGGQSIGVSASKSILPMNTLNCIIKAGLLGWVCWCKNRGISCYPLRKDSEIISYESVFVSQKQLYIGKFI